MMLRQVTLIFALAAFALPLSAQTVLFPVLDASAPGNPDNHSAFFVVQPSRHGTVFILPLATGDTGHQGLAVVSLDGRYAMNNLSLQTTFCSLDFVQHLYFPNPFVPQATNWLGIAGPFASGVLTPFLPAVHMSDPSSQDIAVYFQAAEILQTSPNPQTWDIHFSNGLTAVQTEGRGFFLGAPVSAATAKRGAAMVAGDFNGDGVDDLAVGAPGDVGAGHLGAGRVYVYVGRPRTTSDHGGLHPVPYILEEPNLSAVLAGENPGPETQAHFGASLAAGDLDGDGIADLVVGVPEGDGVSGEPDQGEAYIFKGLSAYLPAGLLATPQVVVLPPSHVIQVRPVIEKAYARYGYELAVGDVNGDHLDDLVASAPFLDVSQVAEQEIGAVYVFLGPLSPGQTFRTPDQLIQDSVIASYEHFGASLALGDLDGDLTKEIIVGVPGQVIGGVPSAGKVMAFHYLPAGAADVLSLVNPNPVAGAGYGLAIAAGDLDGDGRDDIVAASDETVLGHPNAGYVHVSRLGPGLSATYEIFSRQAPQSYERFGKRLLIKDLNADGLADLVVGAPGCPTGGYAFAGMAVVYFGTTNPSINDTFRQLHIKSESPRPYALFGAALAAGDFAGVGVNDLVAGEPLATDQGLTAAGRVVLFDDLLHRRDNLTLAEFLGGATPHP